MESPSSSGTFAERSCPRLLVQLHLTRFTGTLRISQGALLKLLYFQGGEIAMASSNDQGDHLAPILMRAGKLKSEQLELARKQARPGTSLARVLVQMGFLTSGELFAGARQQLRQIVAGVLGLAEGRYEIQADYFPREVTSLNVDTRDLLLELIRELPERSFVLLEVGAPDTVYHPAPSPPPGAVRPTLGKTWQEQADRFTDPMTIRAFGQAAGLDDFAASKVVYGLDLFGFLERRREEEFPAPPPLQVSSPSPEAPAAEEAIPIPLAMAMGSDGPSRGEPPAGESPVEEREEAEASRPQGRPPTPQSVEREEATPEDSGGGPAAEEKPLPPSPAPPGARQEGTEMVARGGPIRLEFGGALSPPKSPARSSGPWGIFSIIAGFAILAAAFAWFVFLKEAPAPGGISPAPPEETAAPAAAGAETGPGETGAGETPPAGASLESGASAAPVSAPGNEGAAAPGAVSPNEGAAETTAPPNSEEAVPPGASLPGEAPAAPAPPAEEPPGEKPPASAAAIPPFAAADRFHEGRSRLDLGEVSAAAGTWLEMVRRETKNLFTLQFAIACREESVIKAARRTRGSADFFAVPFTLQGKPCYRLCWGAYPTQQAAQAGKASVPAFFLSEGGNPVVVSLQKLAPPEQR